MAGKNNATCSICGSPYYLCIGCKDTIKLHPYKIHCCSANCYKVFQAIRGFSSGVYTKDEFKSKLKNIDLSNLEGYIEHIKILIKDALKEDEVIVEIVETIEEPIETLIENHIEDIEDELVVERPIYSRKRNYKTEVE